MTEREKMLAGQLYLPTDPELAEMRRRARRLCREMNLTTEDQLDEGRALVRSLFGSIGKTFEIVPPFYCDYGSHIHVGDQFFANYNCIILDCAEVRIGSQVMFAPNVQLYTATHPLDPEERVKGPELAFPITIGNRVWIGGGVIVCPGITIGDDSVIGAGSVVTKDVPPRVVAAGNPCKVIRTIPASKS